ncbi:hypothetical protein P8452_50132 [Trifolium repens]|nr:hypothetical protein P8452_50132 [Trifolium repens]
MQVFSYDEEDLKIVVNYANPSVVSIAAAKTPPISVKAPAPAKTPTPPSSLPPVSPPAPSPTSIIKSWKGQVSFNFGLPYV